MTRDVLSGIPWECASTDPGAAAGPDGLARLALTWIVADVPGTAAAALRALGDWDPGGAESDEFDGRDWWFRCRRGSRSR